MTAALAAGGLAGSTDAYLSTSVRGSFTLTTAPADQWPTPITPSTTTRTAPHERPSRPTITSADPGPTAPARLLPDVPATPAATSSEAATETPTEPAAEPTTDELEGSDSREDEAATPVGDLETATADTATP